MSANFAEDLVGISCIEKQLKSKGKKNHFSVFNGHEWNRYREVEKQEREKKNHILYSTGMSVTDKAADKNHILCSTAMSRTDVAAVKTDS